MCWGGAALIGIIVFLVTKGPLPGFIALLLGVVVAVVVARTLKLRFCGDESAEYDTPAPQVSGKPETAPEEANDPMSAAETPVESIVETEPAQSSGKPAGLAAPDGKADDLKKLKGVGPKLETLLNEHGIFHFSQIAGWGASDVTWMDENLKGFKGRASRDNWVEQARALASGSE